MPDTNYKRDRSQDQPDDLDLMLDASLAKYAAVEPRPGLEQRVLAHLSVEAVLPSRHPWLQWGLAGALAVITVVGVLAWRSNQAPHPVIANHPSTTIQRSSIQEIRPAPHATDKVVTVTHASVPRPAARRAPASRPATHPKLDQFPSPQPLSAEEIALAQYVENFPKEARLIADTQEQFALETQKVMNDAGSEIRPSGSTSQER